MQLTFLFYALSLPLVALGQPEEQSNRHFWHSLPTEASKESIWNIWTDVSRWHQWDSGLQKAEMTEPFALHAKGTITSLEGRTSKFQVVEFDPGNSYTIKTKLPLGALYVRRYFEQKDGKQHFKHEVWFKGLTAGLFAKSFGPKFRSLLPEVLQNIQQIATNP
ncbi:MAG: SRPBCC family protein [Bacteroidota bacterium]